MRILCGGGGVLPDGGVSDRVISVNVWLNSGRGISGFFVSVCLYVWLFDGVKVSAQLSIQVKVILQNKYLKNCSVYDAYTVIRGFWQCISVSRHKTVKAKKEYLNTAESNRQALVTQADAFECAVTSRGTL